MQLIPPLLCSSLDEFLLDKSQDSDTSTILETEALDFRFLKTFRHLNMKPKF